MGEIRSTPVHLDGLTTALGRPYFASDAVRLFLGDATEAIDQVSAGAIDLTVTSPPYNIGKEYEDPLPLPDYVDWCASWLRQIHTATAEDGALWLNLGYVQVDGAGRAVPLPYLLWERSPFFLIQEVVWNYGAGVAARQAFSPRNEKFLWYVKNAADYHFDLDAVRDPNVKYPNQRKNGKLKCNPLGKNPTDVWQLPKVTSGANRSAKERAPHPAQFPEAVVERIIKACSSTGDLVMDPFVGSGTTAVVAARLGRRAIGFEINERYLEHAAKRIEQDASQGELAFSDAS